MAETNGPISTQTFEQVDGKTKRFSPP